MMLFLQPLDTPFQQFVENAELEAQDKDAPSARIENPGCQDNVMTVTLKRQGLSGSAK